MKNGSSRLFVFMLVVLVWFCSFVPPKNDYQTNSRTIFVIHTPFVPLYMRICRFTFLFFVKFENSSLFFNVLWLIFSALFYHSNSFSWFDLTWVYLSRYEIMYVRFIKWSVTIDQTEGPPSKTERVCLAFVKLSPVLTL